MDLLQNNRFAKAAADAGWKNLGPGIRAVWTTPIDEEEGAPDHRIIHCRLLALHAPARLDRLGLRPAAGYSKCGSRVEIDWITAFRLLLWDGNRWHIHRRESNLPRPADSQPAWFDLGNVSAQAGIVELRRCGIDGWWTSWNLAEGGVILEGEMEAPPYPPRESRLGVGEFDLSRTPPGVTAESKPGEVRFRTKQFEVGFSLGRAGFSYLAIDDTACGRTDRNLLRHSPALSLQGIRCLPVGTPPVVAPVLRNCTKGSVSVRKGTVVYDVTLDDINQEYRLEWEIRKSGMVFQMRRRSRRPARLWESSAWTIACDSEVTPVAATGHTVRRGESGLLEFPILFHAPGHGTFHLRQLKGHGACRSDSFRPLTFTSLELKVGETPQTEGDYLLPAGEHIMEGEFIPYRKSIPLRPGTPRSIRTAVGRCLITSMTYRADTATLSNNGNSMHAPLCMDNWSAVATRIGDLMPGLSALDLLRDTLERWLDRGPGYAAGGMTGKTGVHPAEDEYTMTGCAGLLGLAEFLDRCGTPGWLKKFTPQVERELALARARDLDGDGIIESPFRHGMSGGRQWSTNWYDVVSFGWKDAFSNALLYRALSLLSETLPRLGRPDLSTGLAEWSAKLKASYLPAFLNDRTGWLAGWRCKKGLLHDYAFLTVNGAAVSSGVVEGKQAAEIIFALWREAKRLRLPDPRLGLPGNLWPIPDADMIELVQGKPMGHYINGGLTHSQSRHFVGALYAVGMRKEGNALLKALCETLADGSAFGGCNSGIDWRYWDGGPCGYEGLLTDQFGILAIALDRYRAQRGSQ